MAYTCRPSVPTGRGSLKKPEQGHGPHPSPAGGGPIQALLRRYTRNPMPTPHDLKGGPLSGLSRPPRTRQLALYPIISCRISEIRHADRTRSAISYILSKNSKYHIIRIVCFSFHSIFWCGKQPLFQKGEQFTIIKTILFFSGMFHTFIISRVAQIMATVYI